MTALLVNRLTKNFGGVGAVTDLHLDVPLGERRIIVGPNGAGKTTLFNLITGTIRATSGRISLLGQDITDTSIYKRSRLGLGRTFQVTSLFGGLSMLENIILAVQAAERDRWIPYRPRSRYRSWLERANRLLHQWHLTELASTPVRNLSHGTQRQLEIALAMAACPKVLLLDEPTQGLSAAETANICATVEKIGRDVTILMIEHDLDVAFGLADIVTVMHRGRVAMEGKAETVRTSALLHEIYFGASDSTHKDKTEAASESELSRAHN